MAINILGRLETTQAIPITAVNNGTSVNIGGLGVTFIQPANPIEVTIEGFLQFTGISQAANLNVSAVPYIWDRFSNSAKSQADVNFTFYTTQTGQVAVTPFKVSYVSEVAAGTLVALEPHIYLIGAAATWSCNILGITANIPIPFTMTAKEIIA